MIMNNNLKLSLMTTPMIREVIRKKTTADQICELTMTFGIRQLDMTEQEIAVYGEEVLLDAFSRHGIALACLISNISMARNPEKKILRRIKKALDTAKRFHCNMLMVVPFPQFDTLLPFCPTKEKMYEQGVRYLQQAVEMGAEYGIKVCIEDTPTCKVPLCSINECKSMLEAVPGLGLVYDTGNMIPCGDTSLAFYEALKPYICHVHLKDVRYTSQKTLDKCADGRYIQTCEWGKGVIPLHDIVDRLSADGFSGLCSIEYVTPKEVGLEPNRQQLKKFMRYLILSD